MDQSKLRTCNNCLGDGVDPNYGEDCMWCAITGTHPEGIHATWSSQFDTYCVVIDPSVDSDLVIEWARAIDAVHNGGFVVSFPESGHNVGPEIYSEAELRSSLRSWTNELMSH